MKMRGWIVVLLLLNALALAWHWGVFERWGWGPNAQREPERLRQEIKPELLNIIKANSATPAVPALPNSENVNTSGTASDASSSQASTPAITPAATSNTGSAVKPASP